MKQEAQNLYDFLTGRTEFSTVMGIKLFPIVAFADNEYPLATYRIAAEPFTKEADKFTFSLAFCFANWGECVAFTDTMVGVLSEEYNVLSSTVDWNEEPGIYIGIINIEK